MNSGSQLFTRAATSASGWSANPKSPITAKRVTGTGVWVGVSVGVELASTVAVWAGRIGVEDTGRVLFVVWDVSDATLGFVLAGSAGVILERSLGRLVGVGWSGSAG